MEIVLKLNLYKKEESILAVVMAVCVAILDKTSTPLKLSTNDPSRELAFHYVVHASLDVINNTVEAT